MKKTKLLVAFLVFAEVTLPAIAAQKFAVSDIPVEKVYEVIDEVDPLSECGLNIGINPVFIRDSNAGSRDARKNNLRSIRRGMRLSVWRNQYETHFYDGDCTVMTSAAGEVFGYECNHNQPTGYFRDHLSFQVHVIGQGGRWKKKTKLYVNREIKENGEWTTDWETTCF